MNKKKIIRNTLCLVVVFVMLAIFMPSEMQGAKNVRLNRTKVRLMPGQTVKLKISGTKKKIKWKSSNRTVATVNKNGKVKAKKRGKAVITAKAGKKTMRCKVTVTKKKDIMYIKIGEKTLKAILENNSSTKALRKILAEGDITIHMEDYGDMEKVGSLKRNLPTNDKPTRTKAGDLILYQGNSFVIYYDTNEWDFTRLGKIQGVTAKELKEILGDGDVDVTLSLKR